MLKIFAVALTIFSLTVSTQASTKVSQPNPKNSNSLRLLDNLDKFITHGTNKKTAKLSKKLALEWKQIGAAHYSPSFDFPNLDSVAEWNLSTRDTMIYNAEGNLIVSKSTTARSGWNVDSLTSIDSSYIVNNVLVTNIQMSYYEGSTSYGSRTDYVLSTDNKSITSILYDWVDSLKTWKPLSKDSMTSSIAIQYYTNTSEPSAMFRYIKDVKQWYYNDKTKSWDTSSNMVITTNDTMISVSGMSRFLDTQDVYIKETIIFKSSDWSVNNYSSIIVQEFRIPDSTIIFGLKSNFLFNNNGVSIGEETMLWDSTSKGWKNSFSNYNFPDEHGNDTVTIATEFDTTTHSLDTTYQQHFTRRYDTHGNNTETIQSYYSSYSLGGNTPGWKINNKDVNTFAQINTPVINTIKHLSTMNTISIVKSQNTIRFNGHDITALRLFTLNGKYVTSINQPKSESLIFSLTGNSTQKLAAGTYLAHVTAQNNTIVSRIMIAR